jgi:general secretion pathway protein J
MQGVRGDSGFSLMETLVATFILALVSAAGVMLLSGYQEGRLVMKKADDRLAELEIARSILRDDFLSAIQRRVRDEYGSRPYGFQGGKLLDENKVLRLVRGGNLGAMISGDISALDRVEYLFEDGTLTRRRYERADITLETNFTERPLLTGLEGF